MMSSFTTLKKNSRFKSACPSSGPVTFCEGGLGHVHMRSHCGLTRGFLHQPLCKSSRIESTCPSSGPATFCEGDPGHVYARSPATSAHAAAASTHAAFVAPTCAIFSPPQSGCLLQLSDCTRRRPSGSVGTKHFLGPHCLWVFTFRQDASAAASTDTAPATSAGAFLWLSASAATSTDAAPAATSAGASAFSRLDPSSGRPTCSAR